MTTLPISAHARPLPWMLTLAAAWTMACGTTPTSPSSQSNTTPTLSSVSITCGSATLTSVGQITNCSASAVMSNGSQQNRTSDAQWESSNTAVASVSSSGAVTARANGTTTISATYQGVRGTRTITVDVPLTIETWKASVSISRPYAFGYKVTGTIDITLSRAFSPAPSRIRAEFENSLVGGSTNYSAGQTEIHIEFSQDTLSCPNFSNTPKDYLRIIDVSRQVTLVRSSGTWGGALADYCSR